MDWSRVDMLAIRGGLAKMSSSSTVIAYTLIGLLLAVLVDVAICSQELHWALLLLAGLMGAGLGYITCPTCTYVVSNSNTQLT